jgi:sugar lactone lactonase YvrE
MNTGRRWMQGAVVVALALGAGPAPQAQERHAGRKGECTAGPVQTVLQVPGWFEGVAVAPDGDVFTSDQVTFEVFRITPEGDVDLVAKLFDQPNPDACCAGGLGMTFAKDGALWMNMVDFVGDHHGVYRIARNGSFELAVPMNPNEAPFPNGLVFDERGNLYITESITGSVWKVARGERVAKLWLRDDLLAGLPWMMGIGANGIAYKRDALFVVNTDQGTVVRVPIDKHGSPGLPAVFSSDLRWPDGITLGPSDDLYVPFAFEGLLVRVADDGTWDVVTDLGLGASPIAASPAFGRGKEKSTAYVTNMPSSWQVPALVKVDVCQRDKGHDH